jgi:hypothetical protein
MSEFLLVVILRCTEVRTDVCMCWILLACFRPRDRKKASGWAVKCSTVSFVLKPFVCGQNKARRNSCQTRKKKKKKKKKKSNGYTRDPAAIVKNTLSLQKKKRFFLYHFYFVPCLLVTAVGASLILCSKSTTKFAQMQEPFCALLWSMMRQNISIPSSVQRKGKKK